MSNIFIYKITDHFSDNNKSNEINEKIKNENKIKNEKNLRRNENKNSRVEDSVYSSMTYKNTESYVNNDNTDFNQNNTNIRNTNSRYSDSRNTNIRNTGMLNTDKYTDIRNTDIRNTEIHNAGFHNTDIRYTDFRITDNRNTVITDMDVNVDDNEDAFNSKRSMSKQYLVIDTIDYDLLSRPGTNAENSLYSNTENSVCSKDGDSVIGDINHNSGIYIYI
jgi:uncharacterized protein YjbI with pentapeptide repeats